MKFARIFLLFILGCGAAASTPPPQSLPSSSAPKAPSTTATRAKRACASASDSALCKALEDDAKLDAASFAARVAIDFTKTPLAFDPTKADGFDLVTTNTHAVPGGGKGMIKPLILSESEQALVKKNGFVIASRPNVNTFTGALASIYAQHLPLYVTADSILHAVHRSYDAILASLEMTVMSDELTHLLDEMRSQLSSTASPTNAKTAQVQDVDLYLTVARGLLEGVEATPVAGADPRVASALFQAATTASGHAIVPLFGGERDEDFSQFTVRGHYAHHPILANYFRAMMWLGRIDFRLVDEKSNFSRRTFDAALTLRSLVVKAPITRGRYDHVNRVLASFVGEEDSMTLDGIDRLVTEKLGGQEAAANASDEKIKAAILSTRFGEQRIASSILITDPHEVTLPLNRSFSLFGQRYVADSHVLSNVVYDRVPKSPGHPLRFMPDARDVAFAALKNDHAGTLLGESIAEFHYAPELGQIRSLLDAHGDDYWSSSLYTHWLSALRALSPPKDIKAEVAGRGLPSVASTEPWARRVMNTQLASWAELRHDTILYAKQSYSIGVLCDFPDAYVDPYPEFYRQLDRLALRGKKMFEGGGGDPQIAGYFEQLHETMTTLHAMAEKERKHTPFSKDELAFINDAVVTRSVGCGGEQEADGWYPKLFFDAKDATTFDPTIADVHTQVTDEVGADVGRVLHVATGPARLMVVAVDTCNGPRVYSGVVSSYFEKITQRYERLTDDRWAAEVYSHAPPDVSWMKDLISR